MTILSDLRAMRGSGQPVGVVKSYPVAGAPDGWLVCDGSTYPTASYPRLFAKIGYNYGGSGANFVVPDLRGEFVRGLDNMGGPNGARSVDTGRTIGSAQSSQNLSHGHSVSGTTNVGHTHSSSSVSGTTNIAHGHADTITSAGGTPGTSTNLRTHTHDVGWDASVSISPYTSIYANGGSDRNSGPDTKGPSNNMSHTHSIGGGVTSLGTTNVSLASGSAAGQTLGTTNRSLSSGSAASDGGTEARPRNVALTYIIKT